MQRTAAHKNRGFTLVELLLYISISAVILLATVSLLSVVFQARIKSQTISEVESQGLSSMALITQSLRNGASVTSPAAGTTGSSLTFQTQSPATSPSIVDVSGGILRLTEGTATPVPLTTSRVTVSNLSFQNLSGVGTHGTVSIQFTVSYIGGGRNEYTYSETFADTATLP